MSNECETIVIEGLSGRGHPSLPSHLLTMISNMCAEGKSYEDIVAAILFEIDFEAHLKAMLSLDEYDELQIAELRERFKITKQDTTKIYPKKIR